jgi:probable biosynthetic protein (TIGR04098 family)
MPQMLFGGLSERWLLKESGDIHWRMVCRDLGVASGQLRDRDGERLYASFLRVRMESTVPLARYAENESLAAAGALSRFGDKRFFSALSFQGASGAIRVEMATVFITRAADNKSLARATPHQLAGSQCRAHELMPPFGQGYQRVKRLAFEATGPVHDTVLELGGTAFDWVDQGLDARSYVVSPLHDLNGVNLLYFASYPRIHDVCERLYLNERLRAAGHRGDAAFEVAPIARDVFYYGNADPGDELEVRLHRLEPAGAGRLRIWSTLHRREDGARIADVFAVKALLDPAGAVAQALAVPA